MSVSHRQSEEVCPPLREATRRLKVNYRVSHVNLTQPGSTPVRDELQLCLEEEDHKEVRRAKRGTRKSVVKVWGREDVGGKNSTCACVCVCVSV